MTAYLGPLNGDRAKLDYVNFYAHLHRVVDAKIGRLLDALGDPSDPRSLRSRTRDLPLLRPRRDGPLARRAAPEGVQRLRGDDPHPPGDLEPGAVPGAAETDALASLIDLVPTIAQIARVDPGGSAADRIRGRDLSPILAERASADAERLLAAEVDLDPLVRHPSPAPSVQEEIHFTYDDHQAATALQDVPGQPNRIRAVRTARA